MKRPPLVLAAMNQPSILTSTVMQAEQLINSQESGYDVQFNHMESNQQSAGNQQETGLRWSDALDIDPAVLRF